MLQGLVLSLSLAVVAAWSILPLLGEYQNQVAYRASERDMRAGATQYIADQCGNLPTNLVSENTLSQADGWPVGFDNQDTTIRLNANAHPQPTWQLNANTDAGFLSYLLSKHDNLVADNQTFTAPATTGDSLFYAIHTGYQLLAFDENEFSCTN